ncbi:hypothetical protein SAMN04488502_10643 [Dendrosporobacter quercicolus]|uniref:Uncharacterized protein n=1 Tax=Dendrosporobacter quercicolus TaxID=146817 RepID=A0A1G9US27_9FIRM|nr:hypothetical protein SAMN04488502_10643 [Dendrosporobacter quercicolus]
MEVFKDTLFAICQLPSAGALAMDASLLMKGPAGFCGMAPRG